MTDPEGTVSGEVEGAGAAARAAAARAVAAVLRGRSLDASLTAEQARLDGADRGLAAALAYGVLRERRLLDALAGGLWRRPPKPVVSALVLVGLYQLRSLRIPAHAAVHATVAAAAPLGQPRARGLVNAVLRRYQREHESLEAGLGDDPGVRESYPQWLVDRLRADWPARWRELLAAGNRPGPMTLRVNRRQGARADYARELAAAGLDARPHPLAEDALVLDRACAVTELPGFAAGRVSVQDAAAQLAAPLLAVEADQRVLDACAAPGGKIAHLLEVADCDAWAVDLDEARLGSVRENLARLSLSARVRCGDAGQPAEWWDGKPFDRILVDAPCTGTGVIRRHPDIKWLRRESDVAALATRQRALLDALWPLLVPGGLLVFATCSVLRAEGDDVVGGFLAATADASAAPIEAAWGEPGMIGRRIATGEADMDGFYYARLRKRA